MAPILRNAPKNQPMPGTPFVFQYPALERNVSIRDLVQTLKKLNTELQLRRKEAEEAGDHHRSEDLRIIFSYTAEKLRAVVDGMVTGYDAIEDLRDTIRIAKKALR